MKTRVTIKQIIRAEVSKVWQFYTQPNDVKRWNNASSDWHTPKATNDLRVSGRFVYRMEAKNGSEGFDFSGTYTQVKLHELISYTLDDGREVRVLFAKKANQTQVTIIFEAEKINTLELERIGWQAILDNFKKYVESAQA